MIIIRAVAPAGHTAGEPMTVLRIMLTPVLFGEAPAFGGQHSSSGRVAACGDQCLGQKAALNVTEPFAVTRIAPWSPGNRSGYDLAHQYLAGSDAVGCSGQPNPSSPVFAIIR
jgi:hypothetical protein